jgi:hypothetical protein
MHVSVMESNQRVSGIARLKMPIIGARAPNRRGHGEFESITLRSAAVMLPRALTERGAASG